MPLASRVRALLFSCLVFIALTAGAPAQRTPSVPNQADTDTAIRRKSAAQIEATLQAQADAWNRGDIEGFMDGYARTPDLRFASGGTVTRGWQETLDRYRQRYPDRAAMGTLTFTDLEIDVLATNAAMAFGRWKLKTAQGEPSGLFTLLLRSTKSERWVIVADHTSAAGP